MKEFFEKNKGTVDQNTLKQAQKKREVSQESRAAA